MVQHVRKLHEEIELAWHEHVAIQQRAAGQARPGAAASLDPRAWPSDTCITFLKVIYGKSVPEDGVPMDHPWNGRRAALARVVAHLTANSGRGWRPDNLKSQWLSHVGSACSSLGKDSASR